MALQSHIYLHKYFIFYLSSYHGDFARVLCGIGIGLGLHPLLQKQQYLHKRRECSMNNDSDSQWINMFRECGALWTYDGDPQRPHAILGSGRHSVAYFRTERIAENPERLEKMSNALIDALIEKGLDLARVDYVVGIAMSGFSIAQEVARLIGMRRKVQGDRRQHICLRAYLEKVEDSSGKKKLGFSRSGIASNANVLIVDDVFTTGESFRLAMNAIETDRGVVMPFMATLINRSGIARIGGMPVVSVVECHFDMWFPSLCPLCAQGSVALRPKGNSGDNWKQLNSPVQPTESTEVLQV